jgi:hypothetical protein
VAGSTPAKCSFFSKGTWNTVSSVRCACGAVRRASDCRPPGPPCGGQAARRPAGSRGRTACAASGTAIHGHRATEEKQDLDEGGLEFHGVLKGRQCDPRLYVTIHRSQALRARPGSLSTGAGGRMARPRAGLSMAARKIRNWRRACAVSPGRGDSQAILPRRRSRAFSTSRITSSEMPTATMPAPQATGSASVWNSCCISGA